VAARVAARYGDPQAVDQALDFLEKSLALGPPPGPVAEDEDLAGVRSQPRFKQLVARLKAVKNSSK
jgi:hypothetical protein